MVDKIHKSMLQAFIICPYKFKCQYLQNLPPIRSLELQLGAEFHQFAAWFFRHIDPMLLLEIGSYSACLNYFKSFVPPRGHPDLRIYIENFCEFEANRFWFASRNMDDPLGFFIPMAVETFFEADNYAGTVDRIDRINEEEMCVVEYKTGSQIHLTFVRRELAFYCMLINEANVFYEKVTHIACYNPNANDFFIEPLNKVTYKAMQKRLREFQKALEEGNFPKKPNILCGNCWFKEKCVWSDEEVDWNDY